MRLAIYTCVYYFYSTMGIHDIEKGALTLSGLCSRIQTVASPMMGIQGEEGEAARISLPQPPLPLQPSTVCRISLKPCSE